MSDLINNPSSVDLSSLLTKAIQSLKELDKDTKRIIDELKQQQINNEEIKIDTIYQLIKSLQISEKKKEKSDLDVKQEWDMKKLYAEVFKMSYKRNPLKTDTEQVIDQEHFNTFD